MQNLVTAIFDTIGAAVTAFTSMLTSSITSLVDVFYNATSHEFTFLGVVAIIGVGVALVWAVVRLIRGSLKVGTR